MDAILKEFSEHGYANASTNRMVQEAQIGKGMLFYYFKNKEELFRYALEYSLNYISEAYVDKLDLDEPDFITRYTNVLTAKMQAYLENPLPFTFIAQVYLKKDGIEIAPDLHQRLDEMTQSRLAQLFDNVDTSRFRTDIPPSQIFNIVRWSIEGYQNEVLMSLKGKSLLNVDWEPYVTEFHQFLDVLRLILYKEVDNGDSEGK